MSTCFDPGQLRAYLDGELAPLARAAVDAHAGACPRCASELAALRERSALLRGLLPPARSPDTQAAFQRTRAAADLSTTPAGPRPATAVARSVSMPSISFASRHRGALAFATALLVMVGLLALPPVRAAADNLLSVFRIQKVVFVPVDRARVQQLGELMKQGKPLFIGSPPVTNSNPPRAVGSASEAAAASGRAVSEPATLPFTPSSTTYTVQNGGHASFTLDLNAARQVLSALDIQDVALPDTLGSAPVQVDMQPFVSAEYRGGGYTLTLHQSASPSVTMPDGVDITQLGRAALRVLGMQPDQAELLSRQINWNSTLLFPFPTDANNIRQVSVGGDAGLLATSSQGASPSGVLYWQKGDTIFVLNARGDGSTREQELADVLLRTAESVR